MRNLIFILGDQLSHKISSLDGFDKSKDHILMCEVMEEATYVKHHKKKIAYIFSAMRHFAEELKQQGYKVHYTKIDDKNNHGSFFGELEAFCSKHQPENIIITEPGEYRVMQSIDQWQEKLGINVEMRTDKRFICSTREFHEWAEQHKGRKLLMENFYHTMRKKTGYLMEGKNMPAGGKWNYDHENRKAPPRDQKFLGPKRFEPDDITKEVIDLVNTKFATHFGELDDFFYATTREQALQAMHYFMRYSLPQFGDYQDAMLEQEDFLFHSLLSAYLNSGLLHADEVIEAAEQEYKKGAAPLNSVEGFIRQILGWREFVRGLYWLHMPKYAELNFLEANRPVPDFYWENKDKKCRMNCINNVVATTRKHAHSHHIQRLMVTGNFALLAGLDVPSVCKWYLEVYVDAYDWVELPNTLGMALFADNGIMGTKPYISSGAYINRMSNFCKNCSYDVKQRTGDDACPFNYLYWNFLITHHSKLQNNMRMAIPYKGLKRFDEAELQAIKQSANKFFKHMAENTTNPY